MAVNRRYRLLISKSRRAFTLVEMMIVLCLIAIITNFAIPKLRDATNNFVDLQNRENLDVLYTSMRSYYLVLNEFPDDGERAGIIPPEAVWVIPSYYYDRAVTKFNKKNFYELNINPLRTDFALKYDIDSLFSRSGVGTFGISAHREDGVSTYSVNQWYDFIEKRYPWAPKYVVGASTLLGYPEIAAEYTSLEGNDYRNRFY